MGMDLEMEMDGHGDEDGDGLCTLLLFARQIRIRSSSRQYPAVNASEVSDTDTANCYGTFINRINS